MFYTFIQNNSGGYYIKNDVVEEALIIEADSEDDACDKLMEVTEKYSDGCECCGPRWIVYDDAEGDKEPMIYGKPVGEESRGTIIYYLDGTKKRVGRV